MPHDPNYRRARTLSVQAFQFQRSVSPEAAKMLLSDFYIPMFGATILTESPRTMRVRIRDLEARLKLCPRPSYSFQTLARTIMAYERIAQLLEALQKR